MRESLQKLYFTNDPSSFQLLLGFTKDLVKTEVVQTANQVEPGELDAGDAALDQVLGDVEENPNNQTFDEKGSEADDSNELRLKEFMEIVDPDTKQSFVCELCRKEFTDKSNLRKHIKRHHKETQNPPKKVKCAFIECPYCQRRVRTYRLKGHIFHVHKEKRSLHPEMVARFVCDNCDDKVFFSKSKLVQHQVYRHSVSVKCEICAKAFLNRVTLKGHMENIHSDLKQSFVCELCSKEFGAKGYLRNHIKGHHKQGSTKFNCTLCATGRYNQEQSLERHISKCHSGLMYQCEFCDKTLTSPHARIQHTRARHSEKTEACSQCDKKFVLKSQLTYHIKISHHKIRPKKTCPHCSEVFDASRAFLAHVNRHTNNRQFSCDTCGKSFLLENHLKEHTKRHTLPYICDKCDSRFGSSLSLKAHTRVVHEQKQIQCRHGCGWSCWESSNRNRHEKLCRLNPIPKAPYTISAGTASSLTLQVLSIHKYAKIIKAVYFILCLAELQSEIARGKKRVTKLNPLFIYNCPKYLKYNLYCASPH